jgi:flagellar assembly factor FliW
MAIMSLEPEIQSAPRSGEDRPIRLPAGMIGIPEVTEFELVFSEASRPIMWLRSVGPRRLSFPVVEPGPLVADYIVELSDSDAAFLGIKSAEDNPLVLTVITLKSLHPQRVTVNLVGPIIINRLTLIGKQVVVSNYERYSVEHPLIGEPGKTPLPPC